MEKMKEQLGYCLMAETGEGHKMQVLYITEGDNGLQPKVYETEKEAQKDLANDMIDKLEQFLDDKIEYEECNVDDEIVCTIAIREDGSMTIWDEAAMEVYDGSLSDWQKENS